MLFSTPNGGLGGLVVPAVTRSNRTDSRTALSKTSKPVQDGGTHYSRSSRGGAGYYPLGVLDRLLMTAHLRVAGSEVAPLPGNPQRSGRCIGWWLPDLVRNVVQDAANHDVLRPCVSDPDKGGPSLGAPGPRSSRTTQGLQPRKLVVKHLANPGAVGVSLGLCSPAAVPDTARSTAAALPRRGSLVGIHRLLLDVVWGVHPK